ncbi:unnamed protein product [Rotaria sp. Silwood2]|nr:unnamed protein product [Rotaria sp. Silwood2]CAF4411301.1 unnamed protein product [Rotaria sp. Silwood2]
MVINDDDQHITIVAGRTRIWRSITSSTVTYAARLQTLLAFTEILFQPVNDWSNSKLVRYRGGNAAILSAFPSHCAHIETAVRSDGFRNGMDTVPFYKDWWMTAWEALVDAQSQPFCPIKGQLSKTL